MPSKSKDPQPMSDDAIRQRAYLMWEADGRPDGMADHYWMRAAAPDAAVQADVAETARKVRKAMKDDAVPVAPKASAAKPAKTAAAKPPAKKAAASKVSAPAVKAKAASKPPSKKAKD